MSSTGTGESVGKRPKKGEAENTVLSNLIRCNIRASIVYTHHSLHTNSIW